MKRGKRKHCGLPNKTRSLRLPVELWERLEAEATQTGESMNGAVWRILDAVLAVHKIDEDLPEFNQDISIHNGGNDD